MTSPGLKRFRGAAALVVALSLVSLGARPASGAPARDNEEPRPLPTEFGTPAADGGTGAVDAGQPATESNPTPSLQLSDEGPTARKADARHRWAGARGDGDDDERPFWKSWIFWAVTGALLAGAATMLVLTSSGEKASLAPCPPDVVVSLGCFGAGR